MNTFTNINYLHRNKTGKTSDKWASYLTYYDQTLNSIQSNSIRLLEIGVQNGGSLDTWAAFFQNGQMFVGCDVDAGCATLTYCDPRIHIVIGDINNQTTYQAITVLSSYFDIIIDDGSHRSNDIINSFINYFPLLAPNGLYIIEDTHCLYAKEYGGGILNKFSAYSFFKQLIDVVSFEYWGQQLDITTYLQTFFNAQPTPQFILDGWIDSIHFRNSIITIQKANKSGHNKLGERVIVGDRSQVRSLDKVGNAPI